REMLRRLVALREAAWFGDEAADAEPDVVIATPDTDGTGARRSAWLKLLDRIGLRSGQVSSIRVRVLTWESVTAIVRRKRSADIVGDGAYRRSGGEGGVVRVVLESPAPTRSRERLLHVIGRHPCLTVGQLADLLGTRVDRVRRLEMELIHDGLLRQIDFAELPPGGTGLTCDEFALLGLVEATKKGQRLTASWLGLGRAAAVRYHGLSGHGSRDSGRRWRLLRTLQHTLGVNDVFVAMAMAAHF